MDNYFFPGLLSALFRGTDLVPSDVMAGLILLRVRQKRETHELRSLNLLSRPEYTVGMQIDPISFDDCYRLTIVH